MKFAEKILLPSRKQGHISQAYELYSCPQNFHSISLQALTEYKEVFIEK